MVLDGDVKLIGRYRNLQQALVLPRGVNFLTHPEK